MLDSSISIYKNFQNLPQNIQQKLLEFEKLYKSVKDLPKIFVKNTSTFIYKSLLVHGDKYDYHNVDYINSETDLEIVCREHGIFSQNPKNHYSGKGCPECGKIKTRNLNRSNLEEFIKKANKIHNNFYDYCKFTYTNSQEKSIIICPIHGEFLQKPHDHLIGNGCPKCKKQKIGDLKRSNLEDFLQKANKIHNNFYNYSLVDYIHSKKKIKIICPIHGVFEQTPNGHLNGKGCPECAKERQRELQNIRWEDVYENGILYLIECWNDVERFIKIGVTSKTVEERYRHDMPYNYKVLEEIPLDSKSCIEYEQYIIDISESYKPKITFGGYSECLSIDEKYYLQDLLERIER